METDMSIIFTVHSVSEDEAVENQNKFSHKLHIKAETIKLNMS